MFPSQYMYDNRLNSSMLLIQIKRFSALKYSIYAITGSSSCLHFAYSSSAGVMALIETASIKKGEEHGWEDVDD